MALSSSSARLPPPTRPNARWHRGSSGWPGPRSLCSTTRRRTPDTCCQRWVPSSNVPGPGPGGLPLIAIPHPLADNGPSLVEAKASIIVGEIELALLSDAAEVSDRLRHRFGRLTERRLDRGALCLDDACALDVALTPDRPGRRAAVPVVPVRRGT